MFRVGTIYIMFANYTYMSFGHNVCHVGQPHSYVVLQHVCHIFSVYFRLFSSATNFNSPIVVGSL